MRIKYLFLAILSFMIISCGEGNVLEWATDKNTAEAKRDKLDFAFIQGNCQYVIDMLSPYEGMLVGTELYQYSNAVLACSGFDVLKSLNVVLDDGASQDPFSLIQSLMGTSELNADNIQGLKDQYSKVLNSCNSSITSEMEMICGLAAAADSIATISEIALTLSGKDSINATEEGIKEIISGKTEDEVNNAVNSAVASGKTDLGKLSENLNTISNSSHSMTIMAGGNIDLSTELDKFTGKVKDEATNTVTETSLSKYLNDTFRKTGGSGAATP